MELKLEVKRCGNSMVLFLPVNATRNEGIEFGTMVIVNIKKDLKEAGF